MQKFLLNPNETAMENLFRASDWAVRVWLKRKKLRLFREEWDELRNTQIYWTVRYFLRRLREGRYDRSQPFFMNVLSCARSCQTATITPFIEQVKHKISDASDGMERLSFDPDRHPLRYDYEKARDGLLTPAEREAIGAKYALRTMHYEDALKYLWACQDEEAAYEHKVIDTAANIQHRQLTLAKLDAKLNKMKTKDQLYQREYHRSYYWKNRDRILKNMKVYKAKKRAKKA